LEKAVSRVSLVRVVDENVDAAVREAVALAGGLPDAVRPGATVLVKPNVVGAWPSGTGNTTDARVTEAVTRMVLDRNPGRTIIGEGSSVGYDFRGLKDTMHCLEVSGTADVARELGVELVNLNADEVVEVTANEAYVMPTFGLARTAYEADVIIDLPVVKTHIRTGITCGLKNMKGVLPGREKKRTHRMGLDHGIVDLNRVAKPAFTVVDAIVGMEGTHQYPDDCVRLDCVLAGADVVAVDAVCADLMGFDVADIKHVQLAAEAGLGCADLSRIQVVGMTADSVRRSFASFQRAASARWGDALVVDKDACTGCMGELTSLFIYLREAGFADRLGELAVVLGTVDENQWDDLLSTGEGAVVVLGKCAAHLRDRQTSRRVAFAPGCPPHGTTITDAACDALGIDREVVRAAIEHLHDF